MASTESSLSNLLHEVALAGATAVIVVNFTHPIETVKTRLQLAPKSDPFSITRFLKNEGPLALFKGIKPAWMREATYTSLKLGLYGPVKQAFGATTPDAPFVLKFAAGSTAGVLGSVLGNPFDVLKTLMMSDSGKARPLGTVARELHSVAGVRGFYRGVEANAMRACVLNGTKMACYDQIKGVVVNATGWERKDIRTAFLSAVGAGFCMAVTVSPFDMMRTRLMNQKQQIYSGFIDCAAKTLRNEGPLAFYQGFFAIWARFAPQATLQLLVFEQMRKLAGMQTI